MVLSLFLCSCKEKKTKKGLMPFLYKDVVFLWKEEGQAKVALAFLHKVYCKFFLVLRDSMQALANGCGARENISKGAAAVVAHGAPYAGRFAQPA